MQRTAGRSALELSDDFHIQPAAPRALRQRSLIFGLVRSHCTLVSQIIHTVHVGHADVRLDWMLERSIIEVSLADPLPWRFRFSDSEGIIVECLWRIIRGGRLKRTSLDHGHQFRLPAPVDAAAEATTALADRAVTEVHLSYSTGDIQLGFEGDLLLEIIRDSSSYEGWQIYGPGGVCYAAHGSGFSTWTQ